MEQVGTLTCFKFDRFPAGFESSNIGAPRGSADCMGCDDCTGSAGTPAVLKPGSCSPTIGVQRYTAGNTGGHDHGMNVRVRFKNLSNPVRYIRGRDLAPHPANWRTHPTAQLDSLRGVLAEVGFADVVKGFELPDGRVMLIDGHARAEVLPDQEIPVLVLDVSVDEANKLLATFDPIGAMAGADGEKLDALLREVETDNDALTAMLNTLASDNGLASGQEPDPPAGPDEIPEQFQILVVCETEQEQTELLETLTAEGYTCRSLIS